MLRTKGAVGISFKFGTTSFLFIDSHLTAHQQNVLKRNADFSTICASLHLPQTGSPKSKPKFVSELKIDNNNRKYMNRPDMLRA